MAGSPGTRSAPDLPPGPRAALVIATASYQDPALSQLRATADDAQALTALLCHPGIGGFAVTSVIDADERQVRRAVDVFLSGRGTGDVVLVYLSCHGVLDRRNRLYFAAADTIKDQLSSTGIPAAWLLEQLEECRARQQVVILDCCFSGAFAAGSKGDGELDLERRLSGSGRGRAVLTASRSGEYSFVGDALPGATVTGSVFTAGLVEGLRTGAADTGGDGYISVDEAYDFAYRYVLSLGAAQTPQRWLSGGEGAIVLARNPAGIAVRLTTLPEELADALDSRYPTIRVGAVHELGSWLASDNPGRTLTAEQKLRQIADNDNYAVAAVARAYLTASGQAINWTRPDTYSTAKDTDTSAVPAEEALGLVRTVPDRAARFLADAERTAQSITDEKDRAEALSGIAEALAPTDPDHAARLYADAERAAQSITDMGYKAEALSRIAEALAPTDPDRAARLYADAERAAQSDTLDSRKARDLMQIATALAPINPDHAERTAQSITAKAERAGALSQIAKALAPADPGRAARLLADAERTAQSIPEETDKAGPLSQIAKALAPTNPDRAEHTARSITHKWHMAGALGDIAKAVAATDPDRAARLYAEAESTAQSIPERMDKATALYWLAKALAATNPDRAARLLTDAERIAQSIPEEMEKAVALSLVAGALAATDPDRAERIAQPLTGNKFAQARALSQVAGALAATDPDRAERIARSITVEKDKASALSKIAMAIV